MSIKPWRTCGYCICLAELGFRSPYKIQALLEHAPKTVDSERRIIW